jgi:hypothetical protein
MHSVHFEEVMSKCHFHLANYLTRVELNLEICINKQAINLLWLIKNKKNECVFPVVPCFL